jgi:hypothetical protein
VAVIKREVNNVCKPLDKLAVELATHGVDTVHLSSPQIRCRSANQSRFSECTDWRAEMWLRPLDWEGCPPILGGYVTPVPARLVGMAVSGSA